MAELVKLHPTHALGGAVPLEEDIGACHLAERARGLFSVAGAEVSGISGMAPPPGPGALARDGDALGWWAGPQAWFLAAGAAPDLPGAAVTDQSDGWLWLDLGGPPPLLEAICARLCDVDVARLSAAPFVPWSARSVIAHHGVWLLAPEAGQLALLGPRSSARSLYHAVAEAARSVMAQETIPGR